jgi:hypothetical protein
MIDFDPFGKPLREVELEDLDQLSDENVSEGIYVEFKRSLPKSQSVAKVIASFANTHGGYFLIGIAEENLTNIASGQIGVNIEDHPNPKETIRNIVRDHLNPSPNFSTRLIQRPDYDDYVLILVKVPESHDAPHVHSSGKIYTRTGEGSDPISPETDRWTLDKLYERRNEWEKQVERFCQTDLTLTRGQSGETEHQSDGWPLLEIYGIPSTLGRPVCKEVLNDISGFKSIVERSEVILPDDMYTNIGEEPPETPFKIGKTYDAYRASSDGVVAQSWFPDEEGNNDTSKTPETIKFFTDGGMKALLSVPQLSVPDTLDRAWLSFYQSVDRNTDYIRFLDGKMTLLNSYILLNSYLNLLSKYGWTENATRELYYKFRLRNGYRTVLMFESDWFSELVDEFGPPISYENIVEIPRTGTRLLYYDEGAEFTDLLHCLMSILEGFGLPWDQSDRGVQEMWDLIFELNEFEDTGDDLTPR